MIVHVTPDDLFAAAADMDEGREVDWLASDGTKITLRPVVSNEDGA